jgi:hypothetical protein
VKELVIGKDASGLPARRFEPRENAATAFALMELKKALAVSFLGGRTTRKSFLRRMVARQLPNQER